MNTVFGCIPWLRFTNLRVGRRENLRSHSRTFYLALTSIGVRVTLPPKIKR